jgi:hypothetical protein
MILTGLFFVNQSNAQIDNSGKYSLAKKHFETEYERHEYPKYLKSQIQSYKDKVVIDVIKVFEFSEDMDDKFKLILENGLLDPMRIAGTPFVNISNILELSSLNPDYKTKRFSFWIYREKSLESGIFQTSLNNRINPEEYYFELQNENADESTSFEEFVKGAKLTYLGYGGIII